MGPSAASSFNHSLDIFYGKTTRLQLNLINSWCLFIGLSNLKKFTALL